MWISVNERLPEPLHWYLICAPSGYGDEVMTSMAFFDGRWLTYEDAPDFIDVWHGVTHWMPLPDPPKDPRTESKREEA